MTTAETALLFGYVMALPFTLFVPGFLRLWRQREVELLVLVQVGLLVVTVAWWVLDQPLLAAAHALLMIMLSVGWVRTRVRPVARA